MLPKTQKTMARMSAGREGLLWVRRVVHEEEGEERERDAP